MPVNVMLDLETLGTRAGCSILSIGAAEFGRDGIKSTYYGVISRKTCREIGLIEEQDTLEWWVRQDLAARAVLSDAAALNSPPIGEALYRFGSVWLSSLLPIQDIARKGLQIWGNGADFDLPILAHAYKVCGQAVPWAPYNGRCYRTLKNLMPGIVLNRTGTHHNALEDAKDQAEHAVRLLNELEQW